MSFDREVVDGQGALQRTLMQQFGPRAQLFKGERRGLSWYFQCISCDFRGYDTEKKLDFQSQMDRECQKERYSPTLVTGPSSATAAAAYVGQVDVNSENTPSQHMSFSGTGKDQAWMSLSSIC